MGFSRRGEEREIEDGPVDGTRSTKYLASRPHLGGAAR